MNFLAVLKIFGGVPVWVYAAVGCFSAGFYTATKFEQASQLKATKATISVYEHMAAENAEVIDWHIAHNKTEVIKWRKFREKAKSLETPECEFSDDFISLWNAASEAAVDNPAKPDKSL